MAFVGSIEHMKCITQHEDFLAITNQTVLRLAGQSLVREDGSHYRKKKNVPEDELQDSLSLPLLDKFVESLEQLTNPDMVFRDWVDEVKPMLAVKSNDTSVRESYAQMYKKLFDVQSRGLSTNCVEMGSIRRRFAQEFSKEVVKKCGADGSRIVGMSATNFAKEMNDLVEKMKRATKSGGNLKDYSPWLSRFQTLNHVQELEIPGQYTGKAKPLPEYHVKIAGFDEKVLLLKSMRVPKRITILGNDEKEYKFLVKGGEDLRLDQRIEQLFCLMNDIMDDDPACQQRNLSLKTYKVIPMTSRIGVIEWLENTTVFKDFFLKGMTEQEKNAYMSVSDIHYKWLSSFPPVKKAPASMVHYYSMLKKASRRDVERKFSEMQNLIPGDSLRRSFLQLSSSPEAFLMLRSYFARTHGCLSICHYILGIGDRHLNNIMIDLQTGSVVGIDFGHAFGSATQFLALPELMPFRLTRQICNLMLPLRESGQLQSTMVYTLRALRNNYEILLNTMDVFIKEPSLDWQNFARKQAEKQKMSSDFLTDQTWYPREKVNSAKRKLHGDNPAEVMKVDLDLGHKNVDHYRALLAVLLGDKQYNQRARPYSSSVENQVACLIDQATDPNILARTYAGWQPWV